MLGIVKSALLLYTVLRFFSSSLGEDPFGLTYNGGKVITDPVSVSLLWFGTGWEESGQEAIRNAINSLTPIKDLSEGSGSDSDDVPTLRNWWEIVRQYTNGSSSTVSDRVDIDAECFYTGPHQNMTIDQVIQIAQAVFNSSSIDSFGGKLNCTRVFELNRNGIYHAVFSHTVMFLNGDEQMEFINKCSGNFQLEVVSGVEVNTSWTRSPQTSTDQCSLVSQGDRYSKSPNGDERIDSLVGYILAKIAEEVTDQDGHGWRSNGGLTISSLCSSTNQLGNAVLPLFRDDAMNISFNAVGLNGYRYILQYIWDQKIVNCALRLSETCSASEVVLRNPKGYVKGGIVVNHTDGLQPYAPNQNCRWRIQFPNAKVISFSINYVSISSDTLLSICPSDLDLDLDLDLDSSSMQCSRIQSYNDDLSRNFKLMSSKAFIHFTTGDNVPFESRGWELTYSAGVCNGKKDIYDHRGVVSYASSDDGFAYVEGLTCQWLLRGKPGTLVSINFTTLNISKNLDYIAIYNNTANRQIANFSGLYSGNSLPKITLTGEVMIAFSTQTDSGEGWSADFYIASPVDRSRNVSILIVVIVLGFVAATASVALVVLAIRKRKNTIGSGSEDESVVIRVTTERNENQIGEGSSAVVYKAITKEGRSVAVKSFKDGSGTTEREEDILFKSSSHPNIISLIGYSQIGIRKRYLVFEFMSKGSLGSNLKERGETVSWEKRISIALQICSCIQMLHVYVNPPVYHGKITSDNILLDDHFNARLAGFGSANYCRTIKEELVSKTEDVRSFGALLFELLRGEEVVMVDGFLDMNGVEGLDSRLGIPNGKCRIMGLEKMAEIAKWCVGSSSGREEGRDGNRDWYNAKIGDVLYGLKQVKKLFYTVNF